MPDKVNIEEKFAPFTDHWKHRLVGRINDMDVKLVKIKGAFIWHSHDAEDEMFFVTRGRLTMHFRDRDVVVEPGESIIIPHGVEHMPSCTEETHILLVEPGSTVNTGNEESDFTHTPAPL